MSWVDKRLQSVAVFRRFLPHLREHRRDYLIVFALSMLGVGLELLRPWPLKWLMDWVFVPQEGVEPPLEPVPLIWVCVGAALLFGVGNAVTTYFATLRKALVGHAVTRSLRYRLFEHLTELPLSFHAKNKSGDILVRLMGDVPMLRTMLVDSTLQLASRTLLITGMLSIMVWKDPMLTLVVFSVVPFLLLVVRMLSKRISVAVQKQRKKEGKLADFLHEAVAGVAVIQALGRSRETVRRFARGNRRSIRAGLKATRLTAGLALSVESLLTCVFVTTLAYGSFRVFSGDLTIGELTVFLSYTRNLLKPIRSAARHSDKVARGTACGERILEILDAEVKIVSKPDAPPAPESPSELRFDGVQFAYDSGKTVLRDFDVSFRRGEVVGVFGRSGAGKSTMASLAVRLVDPNKGSVRLDDRDIRDLDLQSLRDRFGLCMQETILFGESVRENLLLADPDADDERLLAAVSAAAADGFLAEMEEGLDTVLDTAGGGLSGGQRRRLSLARTLLRGAPILVVDEPFAGLDREAVNRVRDTLVAAAQEGMVLVICHEPEHLEVFDRVVFLHEGRIVDDGPHEELVRRCESYREVLGHRPRGLAS